MPDQSMAAAEVEDLFWLLKTLNSLTNVSPDDFDLYDTNGEVLGRVHYDGEWVITYPEPRPANDQ